MLSLHNVGGPLWEVVTYESLDHNGSKFFLIRINYANCRDPCANMDTVFSKSQLKVNFEFRFYKVRLTNGN